MCFFICIFYVLLFHCQCILYPCDHNVEHAIICVERGSSVVEHRTRNQVSPGSNPPLLPFRRLGIFVLSIDAPVDLAV